MNLTKVSFRARTRGKSPKSFEYQGVGKAAPRNLKDAKTGNPQVIDKDGNPVEYTYERKDGNWIASEPFKVDDKGNLILPDGYSFVTVDDADVSSLLPTKKNDKGEEEYDMAAIAQSLPTLTKELFNNDISLVAIALLNSYNERMKQEAAPESATAQKVDDLAEIVNLLREHKVLADDKAETNWRRNVTMAFEQFGQEGQSKLDFAYSSKLGKQVAKYRPSAVAA